MSNMHTRLRGGLPPYCLMSADELLAQAVMGGLLSLEVLP